MKTIMCKKSVQSRPTNAEPPRRLCPVAGGGNKGIPDYLDGEFGRLRIQAEDMIPFVFSCRMPGGR